MTVPELLREVRVLAAYHPVLRGLAVEWSPSTRVVFDPPRGPPRSRDAEMTERDGSPLVTGESIGFIVPHDRIDRRSHTGDPRGDQLAVRISSRDPAELRHAVEACAATLRGLSG